MKSWNHVQKAKRYSNFGIFWLEIGGEKVGFAELINDEIKEGINDVFSKDEEKEPILTWDGLEISWRRIVACIGSESLFPIISMTWYVSELIERLDSETEWVVRSKFPGTLNGNVQLPKMDSGVKGISESKYTNWFETEIAWLYSEIPLLST